MIVQSDVSRCRALRPPSPRHTNVAADERPVGPCSHGCHSPQSQSPSVTVPDFEARLPARPGQMSAGHGAGRTSTAGCAFQGAGADPNAMALTPEPAPLARISGRLLARLVAAFDSKL